MFDNFRNFQGGGGVPAVSLKWKILRGGGVLYDIPSVVGVWIFSGTTHSKKSSLELDKSQSNSLVIAGKSSHLTRSSSNLDVFESGYCHTRPP